MLILPKDTIDEDAEVIGSWDAVHVISSSKDARLGEGDGGGDLLCSRGGALEGSLGADAHCHEMLLLVVLKSSRGVIGGMALAWPVDGKSKRCMQGRARTHRSIRAADDMRHAAAGRVCPFFCKRV